MVELGTALQVPDPHVYEVQVTVRVHWLLHRPLVQDVVPHEVPWVLRSQPVVSVSVMVVAPQVSDEQV
jgi:hypothetical protein